MATAALTHTPFGAPLVALLLAACLSPAAEARACFHPPADAPPASRVTASISELLRGDYEQKQTSADARARHSELARIETELREKPGDPDTLDAHALALHRVNRNAEAEAAWKKLLAAEPDRYVTLCNYGTFCESNGRFDEALELISRAAALRPGARGGAETLHASRLAALVRQRARAGPGAAANAAQRAPDFWLPEFLPVWEARAKPPDSIQKAKLPAVELDGMVELLRQFPKFGDGWLVAGMLLEGRGDYSRALACYRRAERNGSSQRAALQDYIAVVSDYEKRSTSLAGAGMRALLTLGAAAAAFIVFKVGLAAWRAAKSQSAGRPRAGGSR